MCVGPFETIAAAREIAFDVANTIHAPAFLGLDQANQVWVMDNQPSDRFYAFITVKPKKTEFQNTALAELASEFDLR